MRVLVDAQLPPALARALTASGLHAEHVCDRNLIAAPDADIWNDAESIGAVIITKDEDFALRRQLQVGGPAVVWIRYGSLRNAELLRRVAEAWPAVEAALARAESLIELA